MQDQGTEHTLRGERFYLNYLTMPESAYIPQPSSRQRELKPLNLELVGVICAVKSGPGTKERVTTRVTVYVRSRSTTLKGVFTVRITHSWWRGSQWGTSGDNQGYARHARMVVCVFFCAQAGVSVLSASVCVQCPPCVTRQSQVFWEGHWHNNVPICFLTEWQAWGGHSERGGICTMPAVHDFIPPAERRGIWD